jgi:multidrug efflux system membrane fusion protein
VRVVGDLTFVDNQGDKSTGTVTAKVTSKNDQEWLWPGLAVEVQLTVEIKPKVPAVPASAVLPAQQGMIAWVIGADNKVSPREVAVERIVGQTAFVGDGLKAGERVVTDGQLRLAPGVTVTISEPRSPATAGKKGGAPEAKKPEAGTAAPGRS